MNTPTRRHFLSLSTLGLGAHMLPSARSEESPEALRVACIGTGGRMGALMKSLLQNGVHVDILCDVDKAMIENIRRPHGEALKAARALSDYREAIHDPSINAIVVATPDHWHFPICKLALERGKHVYCEKPLTHTIPEARTLAALSAKSKAVTQLGNQGSASSNLRRSMELIQAGLFGAIRHVHVWHPTLGSPSGTERPPGEDPLPESLDWDRWLGPAPARPYKKDIYHPARWRSWFDFGNGIVGDFCCHAFNLPVRALDLDFPDRITVDGEGFGGESIATNFVLHYHFPARGGRAPVEIHFHVGPSPQLDAATGAVKSTFGGLPRVGCLLVGDAGELSAGLWNSECYVRLNDDAKFVGHGKHEAAKRIPETIPRTRDHMVEWIDACAGRGETFSDFQRGGHLTEIGLAGIIPLKTGRALEWKGESMTALNDPEAARLVDKAYRPGWL